MIPLLVALSAVVLATAPVSAADNPEHSVAPQSTDTGEKRQPAMSEVGKRVADWVFESGDNRSLPYVIIDKKVARAYLFNGKGNYRADAPVLIGVAVGDEATPGIGKKSLPEIGPAEKTTPAGRFLAKFGIAAGQQKVLWVDYATSVALHTIPNGKVRESRRKRMLSKSIDDNRVTFGCINVPQLFFNKGVQPLFSRKGGYVYILPDTKSLEEVFPLLSVHSLLHGKAS